MLGTITDAEGNDEGIGAPVGTAVGATSPALAK